MAESREALLVIDLQRAFFEDPALDRHRDRVLGASNALMAAAKAAGLPVFLITTEHSRDRSTWTLPMLDDDQGFLFHGEGNTEIVEGVDTAHVTRMEKTRDSAWFGTDLHLRLANIGIERVVLAGVSTHSCIAQTARDAFAHNLRVTIAADAVADASDSLHHVTLGQLVDDRQATVLDSDGIIARWA